MAGTKSVLIIEDEVTIRDLYRSAFIDASFAVETAGSAEELYAKLITFHPRYIFVDIMLPGTSGLEILEELRNNPAHGCMDSKIVMLTNLAQRSVIDNALQNGADGYIIKADTLPRDLPSIIPSLEEDS